MFTRPEGLALYGMAAGKSGANLLSEQENRSTQHKARGR
jgi:hypothetical protein